MRTKATTEALISQRASYFVSKYGPEGETMADSILQAMQACGSDTDRALWTGIVAAVQRQTPRPVAQTA